MKVIVTVTITFCYKVTCNVTITLFPKSNCNDYFFKSNGPNTDPIVDGSKKFPENFPLIGGLVYRKGYCNFNNLSFVCEEVPKRANN